MTAITHQLIALGAALWVLTAWPVAAGPVVGILAVVAVMIGALTPDLDQPAANIWRRMLGGRTLGNIFQAFSGGHRHFTHSLLGIAAIACGLQWVIAHLLHPEVVAPAQLIWRAFMIGYISHPIVDSLTDRGVPWAWPVRWHLRLPPGPEELRVTSGSFVETFLVRPGVLAVATLLAARHWALLARFFGW